MRARSLVIVRISLSPLKEGPPLEALGYSSRKQGQIALGAVRSAPLGAAATAAAAAGWAPSKPLVKLASRRP